MSRDNHNPLREACIILFFFSAVLLSYVLLSNSAGNFGVQASHFLLNVFGITAYLVPLWIICMSGISYVHFHKEEHNGLKLTTKLVGCIMIFLGLNGVLSVFSGWAGGLLGKIETQSLVLGFGSYFSSIAYVALIFMGLSLSTRISWFYLIERCFNAIRSRNIHQPHIIPMNRTSSNNGDTEWVREEPASTNVISLHQRAGLNQIEECLEDFGIDARVVHSTVGPVVTCYQLKIPRGIKAASLLGGVADDIARDMGVDSVRITNGKNTVGLEIPNRIRKNVLLKEILKSDEFQSYKAALALGLGVRTDGSPMTIDLAKMPHLLVAGTTGSGKSVQLHCMVTSLLERSSEDNRKLMLIDPKRVEFLAYHDLPQLVTPVIIDMNQASLALSWCVSEMENRYALMSQENCRSVIEYNKHRKRDDKKIEPLIVIVDEFADLLSVHPESEDYLVRLAQKSRAASIHLILATQRPSSDVITPHLKANIAARIAFKTSSKSNSRVILDESGAERLLGQGDMLLLNPQSQLIERVHGALISDQEIQSMTNKWRGAGRTNYVDIEASNSPIITEEVEHEDGLMREVTDWIKDKQSVSATAIQTYFRVGYSRASRILQSLEEKNLISEKSRSNGGRQVMLGVDAVNE